MKSLKTIFTLIFALITVSAFAQSRHFNAQTLGMGGGGTALADGYHANFINPANLMLKNARHNSTQVGIAGGIGLRTGGTLLNLSVYDTYLTSGLTISGQIREDFLNDWFGSDVNNFRQQSLNLNIVPLGVSHRSTNSAYSLASRVRVIEGFEMNKGLAELVFYGADSDQFSSPVPVNFGFDVAAFTEISVGYARKVLELPNLLFARDIKLYAGIAPKYIIGMQAIDFDFNSTLQVQSGSGANPGQIVHNFGYSARTFGLLSEQLQEYDRARDLNPDAEFGDYVDYDGSDIGTLGSGFGLDLGGTLEMDISGIPIIDGLFGKKKTLRVSMSITDLGKVSYDKTPSAVEANGVFTYQGVVGDNDVEDYFNTLADSLQDDIYGNFSANEVAAYDYKLPGIYNFGASLTMGKLTTVIDYGFGFNNTGTNSKRSTLNLGAEYRFFGILPVRVGTRVGGYSSAAYSAGIGLDLSFLELSASVATVKNSENNGSSAAIAMSGLVIRF